MLQYQCTNHRDSPPQLVEIERRALSIAFHKKPRVSRKTESAWAKRVGQVNPAPETREVERATH
jgi:hypothetical protein